MVAGSNARQSPCVQAPIQAGDSRYRGASKGGYAEGNVEQYAKASGAEVKELIMKYAVVIEKGPTSYGAHVPDLPGCVAAAETRDEVCELIREAIQLYIEALEEEGLTVPKPQSYELIEA